MGKGGGFSFVDLVDFGDILRVQFYYSFSEFEFDIAFSHDESVFVISNDYMTFNDENVYVTRNLEPSDSLAFQCCYHDLCLEFGAGTKKRWGIWGWAAVLESPVSEILRKEV